MLADETCSARTSSNVETFAGIHIQVGPFIAPENTLEIEEIRREETKRKEEKRKREKWIYSKVNRFITSIGWIIATAMCIWYIIDSSDQYNLSLINPTTATSYVESVPLPYPAITVCNWNAQIDCSYCNLTLKHATKVNSDLGIVEELIPDYDFKSIYQNGQLFNCYVFNNRSSTIMNATDIGYAGTISFFFQVPSVPEDRDSRYGLQVSFHETGTIPNAFSETNFAISGVDNYFILTKIITNRIKPSVEYGLSSVRWRPQLSVVELTRLEAEEVVISVAYSTLNVNVISEVVTTNIEALLGQIAGIIGIFMGLDILKLLRGVLEIPYAIEKKYWKRLWKIFN